MLAYHTVGVGTAVAGVSMLPFVLNEKIYIIESFHGTISPLPRSTPHPLLDNALTSTFATVNFLNPTVTSRRLSINFLNPTVTSRRILIERNPAFVHIIRYKIQGYRKWYYSKIQTYLPPFSPPSTRPKNAQTTLNPSLLKFSLARHWVATKSLLRKLLKWKLKH